MAHFLTSEAVFSRGAETVFSRGAETAFGRGADHQGEVMMDSPSEDREKPLVLIVDDETTARLVTGEVLRSAGFDVKEAENGAEALRMLDEVKPDIVVADVLMPVMDGFELCREIRQRPDSDLLPVLIVTGLDDVSSIHRAYEVGATDFITKPFNWLVLTQRIRHMLRERGLVEDLLRSEAENRALLRAIPDAMFRVNDEGTLLESKYSRDSEIDALVSRFAGQKLYEALPLGVAQRAMEAVQDALVKGTAETLEHQLVIDGVMRDFETRIVAYAKSEALGIIRDITQRKRAEAALRESEERYALALRGANDGVWDWDLRNNEIHYSLRWKEMLGWEDRHIGTSPDEWLQRIHPEDVEQFRVLLNAHLEGTSPHFEVEHRIAHKDGTYLWVLTRGIAVRDEAGRSYRMAGSQADVTDRRRANEQLERDALYDPLTGLSNRTLLMKTLEQSLGRAKRSTDETFAVLFLDLDRFKNVNDTLGHLVGDKVLIAVAERLLSCVRPGDTVARIGGDEFVILLENVTDLPMATMVTERIEQSLTFPLNLEGQEIFMPASIGILVASGYYDKAEDILRDADIAVYRAKAMGRGCHVTFHPSMYQRTLAQLELESDLRRAIDREEFFLQYQPIVSLESGSLATLEALIRWQHPVHGLVSPAEFIPLAEETGLIIPIGEWVLRRVCKQIVDWQGSGTAPPIVAVNVSGHQLRQDGFAGMVRRVLDEQGVCPSSIELEITESVLVENMEQANKVLSELKAMGLRLTLDDFGTGYSSLSYLHRFPIQKLKIDRSFIMRMGQDSNSLKIVSAVFQMAKELGLDVVAEGVETKQAVSRLQEMGCELAQGFYFARPTGPESLALASSDDAGRLPHKKEICPEH
jgi:diguanylate cyclase (GGDEF)-like protein/PAS domain S-box-containing protein